MCNCIKEAKEKIQNEIAEKNSEYANLEIYNVTCENEAWLFTEKGMISGLSIPFMAHHKPIGKKKKTQINMAARYCPFCGNPYETEEKKFINGKEM